MEFKRGDRVTFPRSGRTYRIESGPWPGMGNTQRYLLEVLTGDGAGQYRFCEGGEMIPAPPQVGDRGRIASHLNPMRKIREIAPDYVVSELISPELDGPGYDHFVVTPRPHFDSSWRPE